MNQLDLWIGVPQLDVVVDVVVVVFVVVGDSGCLETVDPPSLGTERGVFIVPAVVGRMRRTALFTHYGAARKTGLHNTRGLIQAPKVFFFSSPVTGLEWPRGFREVKVPRFHDNGTWTW